MNPIPEAKQAAASRALEAAFGVTAPDAVTPLAGADGLGDALAYRVEVAGGPYLLRFVKDAMPGVDPAREFANMALAAEAGVAPKVWHASVEDRVAITAFVDARPIPADAAGAMAETLRRLHALPAPAPATRYLDMLDGFVRRFVAGGLLPAGQAAALAAGHEAIAARYPRDDGGWVLCHHDLKPPNTLWDGRRFWLVDWEASFAGDRYVDLAIAASFHANEPAAAEAFLTAYFGAPPTAAQRARFELTALLVGMFYVAIFGGLAARAGEAWAPDAPVPDFAAFHREIVAGTIDLGPPAVMRRYAHVHLARVLDRLADPRFAAALADVGGG